MDYPHFVDIIRILWISTFHGYYPHFVDIIRIGHITICIARNFRLFLHSFVLVLDIICIGHITYRFVLVVDIIFIGHITRYFARNVCPIFHIYSYSVSDRCSNREKASSTIYYFLVYIQYPDLIKLSDIPSEFLLC